MWRANLSLDYSKSTVGEILFACLLSGLGAIVAAVAGFFFAAFLCAKLLSGEAGEAALIFDPATALACGAATFYICYRRIIRYGSPSDTA